MNSHEVFIHNHQGCFAGTGAIVRLPQCQWSKPDGYGKISQCITTTKHSKAKTVCIFLGIYCKTISDRYLIKYTERILPFASLNSIADPSVRHSQLFWIDDIHGMFVATLLITTMAGERHVINYSYRRAVKWTPIWLFQFTIGKCKTNHINVGHHSFGCYRNA